MNKLNFLKYYKVYPSGIVLLGILTSLIPFNIAVSWVWVLIFAAVIAGIIFFMFSFRVSLNYLLWCMIGVIAFYLNLNLINLNNANYLQRGLHGSIKFSATDNSLTAKNIDWLKEPKEVYISVSALKKDDNSEWGDLSGKFYMKILKEAPSQLIYGRSYEAEGTIMPADKVLNKSFSNYLKSIGVIYVFYPESIKVIDGEISLKSKLTLPIIEFRDKILERCVSGINDISVKEFLAGILFGFRQGFDYDSKNKFLETGTIHIIAISGSHIGILALLFLFLLKPLSIRLRYLSVPIILLIYVVAIGYLHSAVRAFIMVSIFFIFKAVLRVSNPFNTLFFTCSIMLIFNPYSLLNPGFLFSFVIVLFLLLGWKIASELKNCCDEKGFWLTKKRIGHSVSIKKKMIETVVLGISSTLIAALASVPLQLLYNGLFTPIVPVVSILVLPLMFPLFFLCAVKAVFFGIFQSGLLLDFLNLLLSGVVNGIFDIVRIGYDLGLSFYLIKPDTVIIAVFYLALVALMLTFNRKLISLSMVLVLSVIILIITIGPQFYKDKVIFLENPGSTNDSIVIVNNSQSSATIINSPINSAFEIQNTLKEEGINRIDNLILLGADKNISGGALKLIETYENKLDCVAIIEARRNTKLITRIENTCQEKKIYRMLFPFAQGSEVIFYDGGKRIHLSENNHGSINLNIDGKDIVVNEIENSSKNQRLSVEL